MNVTAYNCEGMEATAQCAWHQYIWRLTASSYLGFLLACCLLAMMAFCCMQVFQSLTAIYYAHYGSCPSVRPPVPPSVRPSVSYWLLTRKQKSADNKTWCKSFPGLVCQFFSPGGRRSELRLRSSRRTAARHVDTRRTYFL